VERHGYLRNVSARHTFSAKLARHGDRAVVTIGGDIDLAGSAQLRLMLRQIDAGESVVVDCSEVTFMGTVGFRALLYENHRHSSHGGSLQIREPSQFMRRLLVTTGMTYLIEAR
jgi:anti-sigma B factor antagonist